MQTTRLIQELPEWQNKSDELIEKEKELSKTTLELQGLKNEIAFFQNNQEKIANSTCPFSNQTCKNIEEGLMDVAYFKNKIKEKEQEYEEKQKILKKLNEALAEGPTIKNKLDTIKEHQIKEELLKKLLARPETNILPNGSLKY